MSHSHNTPLISIIMPAYNAGRYIAEAIRSIQDQTYPHWELIIVDDASTDDTREQVLAFQDSRIYLLPSKRIGNPSAVRNIGLQQARGEFITCMDSDDAYYPDGLEKLIKPLLEKPACLASMGFPYYCNQDLSPREPSRHLVHTSQGDLTYKADYALTWENICAQKIEFFLCSLMFRRAVLNSVGLLDERLFCSEDFKFHVQLLQYGFEKVHVTPTAIYRYRHYEGSVTKNPERFLQSYESHLMVVDWLFSQPYIPQSCQSMKEHNLSVRLASMVMTFIRMNRVDLARKITWQALQNPDISFRVWYRYFWKQIIKMHLPHDLRKVFSPQRSKRLQWKLAHH